MALMVGQIQALITADKSQYSRTLDQADRENISFRKKAEKPTTLDGDEKPFVESTERAIRAAGVMRARVGSFMGELRGELLAVGAVAGIVEGFRAVVMAASDLSESANAINVTFGDAASTVFDFTSTASRAIGQSNTEARQAAATFGVYAKQAGLADQQAASFSITLTKLASDLASFRNTSPAEAIEAIGAALRGESDPIEKYGVLLTEAVIQQRALKMGIIETTSQALTPQQRVLVAYQEILEQTRLAQGDFQRTQHEFANQLRELRARVIDQAAALGQDLLPAAKSVVSFLNDAVGPTFEVVGGILRALIGTIGGLADAWSDLPGPVQAAIAALLAWKLVQDNVTDGVENRLVQPWRTFSDEVKLHTALAAAAGHENIGKLAASMSVLESRIPVVGEMGAAFRTAKGDGDGFTNTLRSMASAAGTGLKAGLSSLMGVLGGPWGVAIAAGTLLLGQWIAKNQEAKRRQEELAAAGRRVAEAIREQNGEINKASRAAAAKEAEDSGLLETANKLGISLPKVTDAILGQGKAYDEIKSQVQAVVEAKETELRQSQDRSGKTQERIQGEIDAYNNLLTTLGDIVSGRNGDAASLNRLAEATGLTTEQVAALAGAAGAAEAELSPMAEAMNVMADESANAEEKVSALQQALDAMTQERLSVEEATQAINDTLREMGKAFDEAKNEAAKAGVELLNASGAIDTTTAAGSALQDKLVQLSSDYNGLFAATVEAAQAQGKTLPEALVAAAQATGPMRQKFLEVAEAAGLNEQQVQALIERYGLVPQQIATMITQPGMLEGIMNALGLKEKIEDIPNGWQTILTSTAPEQIALMEQLGFKVQTLPNGRVLVTADTEQAWSEINKILTPKTLTINLQAAGFHGAALASARKQYGFARGGYMSANPIPRAVGGGIMPRLPYKVGEEGEEVIWPDRAGFVSTAAQTRELLRMMSQIDRRMLPATVTSSSPPPPVPAAAVYGGDGAAMTGTTYVDRSITVTAARSVPTIRQLQDLMHEQEVLYGA